MLLLPKNLFAATLALLLGATICQGQTISISNCPWNQGNIALNELQAFRINTSPPAGNFQSGIIEAWTVKSCTPLNISGTWTEMTYSAPNIAYDPPPASVIASFTPHAIGHYTVIARVTFISQDVGVANIVAGDVYMDITCSGSWTNYTECDGSDGSKPALESELMANGRYAKVYPFGITTNGQLYTRNAAGSLISQVPWQTGGSALRYKDFYTPTTWVSAGYGSGIFTTTLTVDTQAGWFTGLSNGGTYSFHSELQVQVTDTCGTTGWVSASGIRVTITKTSATDFTAIMSQEGL